MVVVLGLVVMAVVLLLALAYDFRFSPEERQRRLLDETEPTRIADVHDGDCVTIEGLVRITRPVRAPVSGKVCAGWRLMVFKYEVRRGWDPVLEESEVGRFALQEKDGDRVRVEEDSLGILTERFPRLEKSGGGRAVNEQLSELLSERGFRVKNIIGGNHLFGFHELCIEEGEEWRALGIGRWETKSVEMPSDLVDGSILRLERRGSEEPILLRRRT